MGRAGLATLLFLLPGLLGRPSESGIPQEPSFRSASAELVVLPVLVTDKQGKFITDLPRDRFVVFDNGRPVPIALFTNQDTPVTIGLVIDASTSMRPKMREVLTASVALARSSNPEDEVFALRFNDDVEELPAHRFLLASEVGALEAAIAGVVPDGRTALYDALLAGLDRLGTGSRPRKALVVISDGGDNASTATRDQVLVRARRSNAAIYTIGLFDERDDDRNPRVLKSLANETGGERFLPTSADDLTKACERIAREIRSGYTIGYEPPDRDGAFHHVRVGVQPSVRNYTIRTRPGYFAAGPARP